MRGSGLSIKSNPSPQPSPIASRGLPDLRKFMMRNRSKPRLRGRGISPPELKHWMLPYASQRQSNSGDVGGGDRSGVQPVNFSIE